jgi:hypothetical protein
MLGGIFMMCTTRGVRPLWKNIYGGWYQPACVTLIWAALLPWTVTELHRPWTTDLPMLGLYWLSFLIMGLIHMAAIPVGDFLERRFFMLPPPV